MNPCVRTGIEFTFEDNPQEAWVGDLFYEDDCFSIKGIPQKSFPTNGNLVDIIIKTATFRPYKKVYLILDKVEIVKAHVLFKSYVHFYYPGIYHRLP